MITLLEELVIFAGKHDVTKYAFEEAELVELKQVAEEELSNFKQMLVKATGLLAQV